jgi:hypothetical protein
MPKVYSTTQLHVTLRPTIIYGLFESTTGECRYVGKTTTCLVRRFKSHLHDAMYRKRYPVQHWLAKRMTTNALPVPRLLEEVPAGDDWIAREQFWIAYYRDRSARLLNLTAGGEGLDGLKRSSEIVERIHSQLRQGAYFACHTCRKKFWRRPKDIKRGHNKFCSRPCFALSLKGKSRLIPSHISAKGRAASSAARLARKHCPSQHEFTPENTRRNKAGARICKVCEHIAKKKYLDRKRIEKDYGQSRLFEPYSNGGAHVVMPQQPSLFGERRDKDRR